MTFPFNNLREFSFHPNSINFYHINFMSGVFFKVRGERNNEKLFDKFYRLLVDRSTSTNAMKRKHTHTHRERERISRD